MQIRFIIGPFILVLIALFICLKLTRKENTYSRHYLLQQRDGIGTRIFEHNNTDWITPPYNPGDTVWMDAIQRGFSKSNTGTYLHPFVILEIETIEN